MSDSEMSTILANARDDASLYRALQAKLALAACAARDAREASEAREIARKGAAFNAWLGRTSRPQRSPNRP